MTKPEGGWKHTPRRRRAAMSYAERGTDYWLLTMECGVGPGVQPGDYPEVAEDVHPRETFTHEP